MLAFAGPEVAGQGTEAEQAAHEPATAPAAAATDGGADCRPALQQGLLASTQSILWRSISEVDSRWVAALDQDGGFAPCLATAEKPGSEVVVAATPAAVAAGAWMAAKLSARMAPGEQKTGRASKPGSVGTLPDPSRTCTNTTATSMWRKGQRKPQAAAAAGLQAHLGWHSLDSTPRVRSMLLGMLAQDATPNPSLTHSDVDGPLHRPGPSAAQHSLPSPSCAGLMSTWHSGTGFSAATTTCHSLLSSWQHMPPAALTTSGATRAHAGPTTSSAQQTLQDSWDGELGSVGTSAGPPPQPSQQQQQEGEGAGLGEPALSTSFGASLGLATQQAAPSPSGPNSPVTLRPTSGQMHAPLSSGPPSPTNPSHRRTHDAWPGAAPLSPGAASAAAPAAAGGTAAGGLPSVSMWMTPELATVEEPSQEASSTATSARLQEGMPSPALRATPQVQQQQDQEQQEERASGSSCKRLLMAVEIHPLTCEDGKRGVLVTGHDITPFRVAEATLCNMAEVQLRWVVCLTRSGSARSTRQLGHTAAR